MVIDGKFPNIAHENSQEESIDYQKFLLFLKERWDEYTAQGIKPLRVIVLAEYSNGEHTRTVSDMNLKDAIYLLRRAEQGLWDDTSGKN